MHVNATVSSLDFFWSWQEDYVGAVPLMFAAKGGSIEAAELLVSRLMRRFNRAFPAAGWMIITHHIYDSYEPLQCHRLIMVDSYHSWECWYPSNTHQPLSSQQ